MNEKVKHLPLVKRQLEQLAEKITSDIQNQEYTRALGKINFLEEQQFFYPNLYSNKLFCLTKLERWDEVEFISESLLKKKSDPNIADYFLYYVTSLYHRKQYHLVIELINEKKSDNLFSKKHLEYLLHLYNESFQKINEKLQQLYKYLEIAVVTKNEIDQWLLFNQWKILNVPPSELIIQMLTMNEVNPFVKTNILFVLHERKIDKHIFIRKNDQELYVNVLDLYPLEAQPIVRKTLTYLDDVEQNDPSLYSLTVELLQRYFEYDYPFFVHEKHSPFIAKAAITIAQNQLLGKTSMESDEKAEIIKYKNEILTKYEAFLRLTIT